eukprot:3939008-Rhodomonas_salina.2
MLGLGIPGHAGHAMGTVRTRSSSSIYSDVASAITCTVRRSPCQCREARAPYHAPNDGTQPSASSIFAWFRAGSGRRCCGSQMRMSDDDHSILAGKNMPRVVCHDLVLGKPALSMYLTVGDIAHRIDST